MWTDERVEMLKKLYADGLACSQIAAELSCGFTRNAIIGKIHRLGLDGREKKPSKPRARRAPRPATKSARAIVHGPEPTLRPPEPLEDRPELRAFDGIVPFGQRKTLLELQGDSCRWPIGDPANADFYFCGGLAETKIGGEGGLHAPYCSFHMRVAYQPADRRPSRPYGV